MITLGTKQSLKLLGDKEPEQLKDDNDPDQFEEDKRFKSKNRDQLKKLVGSNMLADIRYPGSRNLKLNSDEVEDLAAYPVFHLKKKVRKTTKVLALHLHPIEEWHGPDRPMWGYDVLNKDQLNKTDRELAWVGYWKISAERAHSMIGHIIVGDIAGWIPPGLGRRVTEVIFTEYGVLFGVEDLTAEEEALFTGKRFRSSRGAFFEYI